MSAAEVTDALQAAFDYRRKLGGFEGKTLVLHARFDELIGSEHAEMLHAAAREPKQLTIFAQGGHNDIFYRNQTEYQRLVEAFLETV